MYLATNVELKYLKYFFFPAFAIFILSLSLVLYLLIFSAETTATRSNKERYDFWVTERVEEIDLDFAMHISNLRNSPTTLEIGIRKRKY